MNDTIQKTLETEWQLALKEGIKLLRIRTIKPVHFGGIVMDRVDAGPKKELRAFRGVWLIRWQSELAKPSDPWTVTAVGPGNQAQAE